MSEVKAIGNPSLSYLANLALFIRASFEGEIGSIPGLVETLSDTFIGALFHFPHIRFSLLLTGGTRCSVSDTTC